MPLLTVNEQKLKVDVAIVEKAIAIMDWQLEVRKLYDPIDADNAIAKMEEKIRRYLGKGPLGKRELKRKAHVNKDGLWIFKTAIKNLTEEKEVHWDKRTQTWNLAN